MRSIDTLVPPIDDGTPEIHADETSAAMSNIVAKLNESTDALRSVAEAMTSVDPAESFMKSETFMKSESESEE